jgi:hypothetical protein
MGNYVINLDRRPDKWAYMRCELERVGIRVTRFPAFDTKPGWKGCGQSHIAIMEQCKNDKYVTIFEDDVVFLKDNPKDIIEKVMLQLPYNWDYISWGISPQEKLSRYSENLFVLDKKAWCMHAYTINNNNGLIDFILDNRNDIGKIDVFMSDRVYPIYNCFLAYPILCGQVQSKSDTCTRSDVNTIITNYNKFCFDGTTI